MNTNWTINKIMVLASHDVFDDVVKEIHWAVTATDGVFSASVEGKTTLPNPTQTDASFQTSNYSEHVDGVDFSTIFTTYKDLTYSKCIEWIDAAGDKVTAENEVSEKLAEAKVVNIIEKNVPFSD